MSPNKHDAHGFHILAVGWAVFLIYAIGGAVTEPTGHPFGWLVGAAVIAGIVILSILLDAAYTAGRNRGK